MIIIIELIVPTHESSVDYKYLCEMEIDIYLWMYSTVKFILLLQNHLIYLFESDDTSQ